MSEYWLRQLSVSDGIDVYDMLQHIEKNENEFKNPVKGLPFFEFKKWLLEQDAWSRGEMLPEGYVGQTCFWLMEDGIPIGFGKVRHALTTQSRIIGGNLGYAISDEHRGKGMAKILLKLLVEKANEMGIKEKILTVEKFNFASKRVIEANGGKQIAENEQRWFFVF